MMNLGRKYVKMLLAREEVKLKDIVTLLSERMNKKYTADGLSHKLRRDSFSYTEMVVLADILGYDIKFVRRNDENLDIPAEIIDFD